MKIYIGADHNGFHLKQQVVAYLRSHGYEVIDEGDERLDPGDDFPEFASRVATAVRISHAPDTRGILLCGSGQGVCMAANRYKGIRAALGYDIETARATRNDEDSNVLCLPAKHVRSNEAFRIIDTWLHTAFAGAPRYVRRNKQLDELD